MNTSALGSTFEISLRILLLLNEVHGTSLDEQQIGAVDFISVYAADFDLLDENLHGYSNYRFTCKETPRFFCHKRTFAGWKHSVSDGSNRVQVFHNRGRKKHL